MITIQKEVHRDFLITLYMSSYKCSIVAASQTKRKQIYFSPSVVVLYSIPHIYYHLKYQDPTSFCSASVLPHWNSAQLLY